jgi:hypothetical protein
MQEDHSMAMPDPFSVAQENGVGRLLSRSKNRKRPSLIVHDEIRSCSTSLALPICLNRALNDRETP